MYIALAILVAVIYVIVLFLWQYHEELMSKPPRKHDCCNKSFKEYEKIVRD